MSKEDIIKQGLYCGYPKCCVEFFADVFYNDFPDFDILDMHEEREKEIGEYYHIFTMLYCVPCPKCYSVLVRNIQNAKDYFKIKRLLRR